MKSVWTRVRKAIDIRDILLFGGLAMLGRGLYLRWGAWLALIVCGVLLMALAYFMGERPAE